MIKYGSLPGPVAHHAGLITLTILKVSLFYHHCLTMQYDYSAAKELWTDNHENVVKLWAFLPDDMKFSEYLDCFVWANGEEMFEDAGGIRYFARERKGKFIRSISPRTKPPEFTLDLYSHLMPNDVVKLLYTASRNNKLQLRNMAKTNKKSPPRPKSSSNVSIDASFTNPTDEDDVSANFNQLVISRPVATGGHKQDQAVRLKLSTGDNPQRMKVMLNNGRSSSDGSRTCQTLIMIIPLESRADEKYYSMKLSHDDADFNDEGITGLIFTYPISSSAHYHEVDNVLEAIKGEIEDFNDGNAALSDENMVADDANRKWAFETTISNDLDMKDGEYHVKTKTIKLLLPFEKRCQLAAELGTEWQGPTHDSKPADEYEVKKTVVSIAAKEMIFGTEEDAAKSYVYHEIALANRQMTGFAKSPPKKNPSGAAERFRRSKLSRNSAMHGN